MKYLINIVLLGMVFLGIAMAVDTPWGFGVALTPFVIWGAKFLVVVHKNIWAAIVFWGGIAYFQWQVTLVVGVAYVLVWLVKQMIAANKEVGPRRKQNKIGDRFQDSYNYDQRYHIGFEDE